jgi:hypothetical protein
VFPRPLYQEHWLHPTVLGRLTLCGLLLVFAAALLLELRSLRRPDSGWRERLPFYLCAAVLLILPAANTCRLHSMLRYSIPPTAILVLLAGHLRAHRLLPRPPVWGLRLLGAGSVLLLALHVWLLSRYLHGWWVA